MECGRRDSERNLPMNSQESKVDYLKVTIIGGYKI